MVKRVFKKEIKDFMDVINKAEMIEENRRITEYIYKKESCKK